MAEENAPGQEEHIRSGGDTGAVDNNAGFAALEPIEPFFIGDGQTAPVGF